MHPLDPEKTTDRAAQLRHAKRRQRQRERTSGLSVYPVKLPDADVARLRAGMADAEFVSRLRRFLQHEIVDSRSFPALHALCWNRRQPYLIRKDAFALYERNWRHVDRDGLTDAERDLIDDLAREFGQGLLNV